AAESPPKLSFQPSTDGHLRIRDLRVDNPQGQTLIHLADIGIGPGEVLWIDGPSGFGKSTLVKAISGIWRHCDGAIERPRGEILFLPQSAYVPLGSLAAAVTYPLPPEDTALIHALLSDVGLAHKLSPEPAHDENATDYKLSCGERQRLIVARILAAKPDWVFMDEATSALDNDAEKEIYALLRNALPNTAFIVIAHREPRGLGNYRRVDLREMTKQD
ncbi:MAG: ATP-binding cassette domain-containing protein, partial [Candidatus Accumulibacter sp.]|nr:ATP-binding cassette domain-containing protein [Accumulibacter sp.]